MNTPPWHAHFAAILAGPGGLDSALRLAIGHFRAESGTIHVLGADGALHLRAFGPGMPEPVLERIRFIPVGKGMAGLAVERREPVTACNLQTDRSGDVRPGARATGMQGAIVVPIFQGETVVGAFGIANSAERTFAPEEVEELLALGRMIGASV